MPATATDVPSATTLDAVYQAAVSILLPPEAVQQLDLALLCRRQLDSRLVRPEVGVVNVVRVSWLALAPRCDDQSQEGKSLHQPQNSGPLSRPKLRVGEWGEAKDTPTFG